MEERMDHETADTRSPAWAITSLLRVRKLYLHSHACNGCANAQRDFFISPTSARSVLCLA